MQFGFLISFLFVLVAFEYKVPMDEPDVIAFDTFNDIEELALITFSEPDKKLELPKIKKIDLIDLLKIEEEPEIEYIPEDSLGNPNEEILDEQRPFVSVEEMPIFNPRKNKTYEEGCKEWFGTQ